MLKFHTNSLEDMGQSSFFQILVMSWRTFCTFRMSLGQILVMSWRTFFTFRMSLGQILVMSWRTFCTFRMSLGHSHGRNFGPFYFKFGHYVHTFFNKNSCLFFFEETI